MRYSNLVAAALLPAVSALSTRQDEDGEDVEQAEVCYPAIEEGDGIVPPCIQINTIEAICQPNGTDPIDYQAHAQCMCNGSFFSDWLGCQDCLVAHGFRSERDRVYWGDVAAAASSALCTGTPSAVFQSIFVSVQADVPFATTGNTRSSDRFPDETAVSLYFTPEESQGPGRITGAAASATAETTSNGTVSESTRTTSAPRSTPSDEDEDDTASTTSDGSDDNATSTTESENVAPTAGSGMAMALAGAVLMAAL